MLITAYTTICRLLADNAQMKWLTERIRFRVEKMVVFHLVLEFLAFYGPPRVILQLRTVPVAKCFVPDESSLYIKSLHFTLNPCIIPHLHQYHTCSPFIRTNFVSKPRFHMLATLSTHLILHNFISLIM